MSGSLRSVLAADCGASSTKAILIERGSSGWRLTGRGEAPTTVEAPDEDVTVGLARAVAQIESGRGRPILDDGRVRRPQDGQQGVDAFLSASGGEGELRVVVAGVVGSVSTESAARAALTSGAVVVEALSVDDGIPDAEKIDRLRHRRPDLLLLGGGVDGGATRQVLAQAELVAAARPRPRFGDGKLPVVYAGNGGCRAELERLLAPVAALQVVDNVRPSLDVERLEPARDAIVDMFMEHVLPHAPGYTKLMNWSDGPIVPAPGAVGLLARQLASHRGDNVVVLDGCGDRCDVFSVYDGVFNRTRSVGLDVDLALRWLVSGAERRELVNRIGNTLARPATVSASLEELALEQAIGREVLRRAVERHAAFAVHLPREGRPEPRASLVDRMRTDLIVGTGGALADAPRPAQAMAMLIDAFLPEGVTELAVDSLAAMAPLGLVARLDPVAALEVLERDCLLRLGTCIAPAGRPLFGESRPGRAVLHLELQTPKGLIKRDFAHGDLHRLDVGDGSFEVALSPKSGWDVGAGPGARVARRVRGGAVGIVVDCRGRRPFELPRDEAARRRAVNSWKRAMDEYPE